MRRMKAVVKLEVEYDRITACAERVASSCAPASHDILAILESLRREIQWVLSRYNTPELYAKWLAIKAEQSADAERRILSLAKRPGFCQQLVSDIDGYLAAAMVAAEVGANIDVPIETWRQDSAQEVLMFIVMVAGLDLPLRHITMDFLEMSRQIRWPGKTQV